MSNTIRNTTILISLIVCIYTFRQVDVSPGKFLRYQVARFAQEQKISEQFCQHTDMQNIYTNTTLNNLQDIRSGFSKIRSEKTMTDFINRGEPSNTFVEKYLRSIIPYLIPWIVFFGLGLIGFVFCFLNWCCMHCCRRCAPKCCRRPKTDRFKNCYATFSLIFTILTVGAGVAGIIFTTRVPSNVNGSLCSLTRLLEKIDDGSADDHWIGAGTAVKKIDGLVGQVDSIIDPSSNNTQNIGVFNRILNNLTSNLQGSSELLTALYNNNRNITIDRPNTQEGVYQPSYIQNLGPVSSDGTFTNAIQQELNTKAQVLREVNETMVELTTKTINNANQAVNQVESARPSILQVSNTVSQWLTDINNQKGTIDKFINISTGVLLGLFSANTGISILAILSILFVCCGARVFNKSIYLSWFTLGILMVVGWAVATVLFGFSIAVFESCDVGTEAVKSPIFFNKTFDTLRGVFNLNDNDYNRTRNILYRCIHGDGDMAAEFQIRSNLGAFNQIFSDANAVYLKSSIVLPLVPGSAVIPTQLSKLNDVKNGRVADSQDVLADLATLNDFTTRTNNPCTPLEDTWVLNSANCTGSMGAALRSSNPDTFNTDNPTCIGYDVWIAGDNDINDRYTTTQFPQPTCGQQNNEDLDIYVRDLVTGFIANRRQTADVINSLENDLNVINQRNIAFKNNLDTIPATIRAMNSTAAGIYNQIVAPGTGIISNTNCSFVVGSVNQLLDVTCAGFGLTAFELAITYLVMSFLTFFGTLFLFCLAKRFTVKEVYVNRSLAKY